MIERIKINNFQKHRKLILDFDIGITSIVGPSDTGKSAIIRAIRWWAQNTPRGKAFITDGKKKVEVAGDVDGRRVARRKASGENSYVINGKPLDVVKTTVPDEVAQILRLNHVNFQGQHDGPFWLCLNPGEVSRQLNDIVDLTVMDRTLSNLDSEKRQTTSTINVLKKDIKTNKAQRQKLARWGEVDKDLKTLENSRINHQEQALSASLLKKTVQGVLRYRLTQENLLARRSAVAVVVKMGLKTVTTRENTKILAETVSEALQAREGATIPIPDISRLETAWAKLEIGRTLVNNLTKTVKQLEQCQRTKIQNQLRVAKAELKRKLKGRCPACGRK